VRYLLLALILGLAACRPTNEAQTPADHPRLDELRVKMAEACAEALGLRDPVTGWLVQGGDGMLWTGKYASVKCVTGVNILVAETAPGKFSRDPDGETSDNPDWSDWSRDMGLGLMTWAWRTGDRAALERHAEYGKANVAIVNNLPAWRMGQPVGDGRGIYWPASIGRLYQIVFALGGANDPQRLWPDLYVSGLVDYQAHLQVGGIVLRGEVEEALRKKYGNSDDATKPTEPVVDDAVDPATALTMDVTNDQLASLKEHAARDTRDPLFQAALGVYTGDMGPAVDTCLSPDWYAGEYVRCDGNPRTCQLAAWLFACDLVLRRYGD
jgi:hypothetical protein